MNQIWCARERRLLEQLSAPYSKLTHWQPHDCDMRMKDGWHDDGYNDGDYSDACLPWLGVDLHLVGQQTCSSGALLLSMTPSLFVVTRLELMNDGTSRRRPYRESRSAARCCH